MRTSHVSLFNPRCNKQRGAALMVMLVIMVIGSAAFLVSSLSRPGAQIERDRITIEALAQAKGALIAYAVSRGDVVGTRPGDLPCPDTDAPPPPGTINNNYGAAEGSCTAGAIGRLPWKTLGISELVDESGEPLWYAISGNFRDANDNPPPINSDTVGSLDVYDNDGTTLLTPAGSKAVAVVFAPGKIIGSQQRSSASGKTTATNYLDTGPNSRNNATGPFISANKTDTFNDRLIYITTDQLLPAIEKRVAGEIKNQLNAYYSAWHAFPFAAVFNDPSNPLNFVGQASTYYGLLPIGNDSGGASTLPWNTSPAPNFYINGVNSGTCTFSNGGVSNSRLRCISSNTTIPAGQTITFTGKMNGIGLGFYDVGFWFWRPHDISTTAEVRVRNSSGVTVLASSLLDNVSVTVSLNSDGSANVVFSAQGKPGGTTLQRIELRDIQKSSTINVPAWLLGNYWHQVAYYAVSQGYAPGGINSCEPLGTLPHVKPYCLTVNGSGGGNDKRAVVVMTSKALASQTSHPSGTLTNYLEGENATPADYVTPPDYIYENKSRTSTFNDQVIVVAP